MTRHLLMTVDAVGGVWQYAAELSRGLVRHGWTVDLAVIGPPPTTARPPPAPRRPCPLPAQRPSPPSRRSPRAG